MDKLGRFRCLHLIAQADVPTLGTAKIQNKEINCLTQLA